MKKFDNQKVCYWCAYKITKKARYDYETCIICHVDIIRNIWEYANNPEWTSQLSGCGCGCGGEGYEGVWNDQEEVDALRLKWWAKIAKKFKLKITLEQFLNEKYNEKYPRTYLKDE